MRKINGYIDSDKKLEFKHCLDLGALLPRGHSFHAHIPLVLWSFSIDDLDVQEEEGGERELEGTTKEESGLRDLFCIILKSNASTTGMLRAIRDVELGFPDV